jgi:hypothetical protein
MFWYLEKLSEGSITVDYKWGYKNKCGSRGNFKIRFMASDLRMRGEGGSMRAITLTCDEVIMKMTFCFPVEMLDYNQKLRISALSL